MHGQVLDMYGQEPKMPDKARKVVEKTQEMVGGAPTDREGP